MVYGTYRIYSNVLNSVNDILKMDSISVFKHLLEITDYIQCCLISSL